MRAESMGRFPVWAPVNGEQNEVTPVRLVLDWPAGLKR
jgi:hypothetical protein